MRARRSNLSSAERSAEPDSDTYLHGHLKVQVRSEVKSIRHGSQCSAFPFQAFSCYLSKAICNSGKKEKNSISNHFLISNGKEIVQLVVIKAPKTPTLMNFSWSPSVCTKSLCFFIGICGTLSSTSSPAGHQYPQHGLASQRLPPWLPRELHNRSRSRPR